MWLERLERILRPGESARLREWLQIQGNRDAIVQRCKLWHGPAILAVLEKLIPDDVVASYVPPQRSQWPKLFAAVGGVCLVAVAATMLSTSEPGVDWHGEPGSARFEESYRTPVGGRNEIKLPDGSCIVLNTASWVVVSYGLHARSIAVRGGEAAFVVAADPDRTFRLVVGSRLLETDGAQFNVRVLGKDTSQLIVTSGEVTVVYATTSQPPTPAQLRDVPRYGATTFRAMQGGIIGPGWQSVTNLSDDETRTKLAWQQGLIVLADETLDDAVAEVARYTTREFVFADRGLRALRLTAQFHAGDVDGVLTVLRDRLRVESHTDPQGRVILAAARRR